MTCHHLDHQAPETGNSADFTVSCPTSARLTYCNLFLSTNISSHIQTHVLNFSSSEACEFVLLWIPALLCLSDMNAIGRLRLCNAYARFVQISNQHLDVKTLVSCV